jgi:hypothetical protein
MLNAAGWRRVAKSGSEEVAHRGRNFCGVRF